MRDAFTSTRTLSDLPRLPLKGSIDLTYRCNNRCRHCWLRTDKEEGELSKEEIFDIVDQARAISGGESIDCGVSARITASMTRFEGVRPLSPEICGNEMVPMDRWRQAVS